MYRNLLTLEDVDGVQGLLRGGWQATHRKAGIGGMYADTDCSETFTSAARGTYASTNLLNNGFPINRRGVVKCNISPERIKAD